MNRRFSRWLLPLLLVALALLSPARAWAGPVSWVEVPPTPEGRQWWDEGSLRRNRAGNLTVLSRFQATPEPESGTGAPGAAAGEPDARPGAAPIRTSLPASGAAESAAAPTPAGSLPAAVDQRAPDTGRSGAPVSRLYVMELDCDQNLYRDISINGLPQFGASWQPTGSDDLTAEVLRQACAAEAA